MLVEQPKTLLIQQFKNALNRSRSYDGSYPSDSPASGTPPTRDCDLFDGPITVDLFLGRELEQRMAKSVNNLTARTGGWRMRCVSLFSIRSATGRAVHARGLFLLFVVICVGCAGDGTGLDVDGNPISNLAISRDEIALPVGGTIQLTATLTDANGNPVQGLMFEWETSNAAVAVVDQDGMLTALAPGAVTITASTTTPANTVERANSEAVIVSSAKLSTDVQAILSASCAFSGCHGGAMPQLGQNLTSGNTYASIVNVAAVELPSMSRVTPFEPEQSYLVHKIRGTQVSVGGSGGQMPLGGGALPEAEVDIIRAWVQSGAPNN